MRHPSGQNRRSARLGISNTPLSDLPLSHVKGDVSFLEQEDIRSARQFTQRPLWNKCKESAVISRYMFICVNRLSVHLHAP
jgi:hypothetical protein